MVDRHRVIGGVLAVLVAGAGCKKPPPPDATDAGTRPAPPDHLADDEAAEGKEKAFALVLPRASTVSLRFRDSVHVDSTLPPEKLANFVRARVKSGRVLVGTTTTLFENVIVPAEPARHLNVEVRRGEPLSGRRSWMVVKDVTPPPPPPPGESEADRRKKAGLDPDGKLLDPNHMQ